MWGFFAAVVVPIVLVLTGGSIITAVICGAATAGLAGALLLVVRVTGLRLPHLEEPAAALPPVPPMPPVPPLQPRPPVDPGPAAGPWRPATPYLPPWQQPPPDVEWDPFEPPYDDDRRRYRHRAP